MSSNGGAVILLVDDEPDIVQTLAFRLTSEGYRVLTAENGAAALDVMRSDPVDLILADFMMPEMNGIELTRMVKDNPDWSRTKIILFSCNTDPEFRRRALAMGALDYLAKTDGAVVIAEKVGEVLSSFRPPPEPSRSPGEDEIRAQLVSLSQSLIDVLHLASQTGQLPDGAAYALSSARRIAEDIRRLGEADHVRVG